MFSVGIKFHFVIVYNLLNSSFFLENLLSRTVAFCELLPRSRTLPESSSVSKKFPVKPLSIWIAGLSTIYSDFLDKQIWGVKFEMTLLKENMKILLLIFSEAIISQTPADLDVDDGMRRGYGSSDDPMQESVDPLHKKWNHLTQVQDKKILIYWSERVRPSWHVINDSF